MRDGVFAVLASLLLASGQSAFAATPEASFTQMQDLNPIGKTNNSPIRQKWAVVIGISKFLDKRLNSNEPNARAAQDFYKFLVDPNSGRFANDHVRLMTNEAASQQSILNTLGKSWLGRVAEKDDLVVVFLCTNGFATTDGGAYLCSYNCELDNVYSTCVSMKTLMQNLKDSCKAERVIVILQSTNSGSAELEAIASGGAKSLRKSYNVDLASLMLGKGYTILSSSAADQPTFGNTFTGHLITALRQNEGMLPLREAFAKSKELTEYDSTHKNYPAKLQTPVMKSTWTGNDIILGAPPLERVANVPDSATAFLGAEGHYLKASQAAVARDLDAAIKEYQLAIADDPKYADAIADYGAALALKEQWGDAAVQFRRAIELRPDDVLYRTNYARVLDQLGQREECLSQLEYAYSQNPKDAVVLKALAAKALDMKDPSGAERLLKEALVLYPHSGELHEKIAYAFAAGGKLDDALTYATKSVSLNPSSATAKLNLGSILLAKNDAPKAIGCFNEVTQKNPDNADAWFLLGQACLVSGKNDQAKAALSKFVSACKQDDPRLADCKKRLDEMGR